MAESRVPDLMPFAEGSSTPLSLRATFEDEKRRAVVRLVVQVVRRILLRANMMGRVVGLWYVFTVTCSVWFVPR